MAHTRAADDFRAIRTRVEELRRERERATARETKVPSGQPTRRANNDNHLIAICLRQLRNQIGLLVISPDRSRPSPAAQIGAVDLRRGLQ